MDDRYEIAALLRQRANDLMERPLPDGHESENKAAARELLSMAQRVDGGEVPRHCKEAVYVNEISLLRAEVEELTKLLETAEENVTT